MKNLKNYNNFINEGLFKKKAGVPILDDITFQTGIKKYNGMFDYTQLDPVATEEDIMQLTEKARIIEPASICILPKMVAFGKEQLKDTDIMVCTVISFPGGDNSLEDKLAETKQAIADGADEIDMVLDYKKLKENWEGDSVNEETKQYLLQDITQLAEECHKSDITLKVIVESGLLDIQQTKLCTELCLEAGADFIKTSTGKVAVGAELDKVKVMKDTIAEFGGTMFIKASGGIRTIEDVKKFYPYVDRFGVGWGAVDSMNGLSGPAKSNY
jgi:deoxyribose-phosphate aldolase